ncbi:thioredoxin domain-containing protein 9-like [Gigantopelta aegis]|uniref:thioredoxin domain-containing protein 9-like n=1 Tax=Gigantopelta aegis TaxID=1735272 RepID=UPI001B8895DF|nr:thioredoxin domain-containing protein 9-like [Gigantopelta aegis]XP_041359523.1 thioredoxin domain-containing protein 9-like [Gigantopelta aegis]
MEQIVEKQVLQATKVIEQQLDAEIERMEKMDEDDFEVLRQKRLESVKKSAQQNQEWRAIGHGQYSEIYDEKDFFDECKKSKNVACHFYRDSTFRCKIVDKHMALLAPKHMETRFLKINAEKCPFLVERLRIKVLPTICIARDGKTVDYIVGFDELGGTDDFPTEMLEWRLGCAACINYQGDLTNPPCVEGEKSKSIFKMVKSKKTIREGDDDSSDDNDW